MGATTFITSGKGKTAEEVFQNLVQEANCTYGCHGYTGTIAEKNSFKITRYQEKKDSMMYPRQVMDRDDPIIDDKWGSATCIKLKDGEYLFFGLASE